MVAVGPPFVSFLGESVNACASVEVRLFGDSAYLQKMGRSFVYDFQEIYRGTGALPTLGDNGFSRTANGVSSRS
jgi:hypothetical protein